MTEKNKNVETIKFYCGTSNIVLPVSNKGFYPEEFQEKSRLNYYGSLFNSLEINSSFYKIPMPRTVAKWADDVPENFNFTFKLWKGITHSKELNYDYADIEKFLNSVNMAGQKKACLLVQFPGSIKFSLFSKVKRLLEDILSNPLSSGWKIAVEFRDKSWYREELFELIETQNIVLVQHDMPASATPFSYQESNVIFLRFHGEKGDYRGSYSNEFLEEYAGYIKEWIDEGKTVFAYFNNTIGDAVHNAISLKKYFAQLQ